MNIKGNIDHDKNLFDVLRNNNQCKEYNLSLVNNEFTVYKEFNLNIISFNVRSFYKNCDEFVVYISHINIDFDIMILTETWINHNNKVLCSLNGYKGFHSYRNNRTG